MIDVKEHVYHDDPKLGHPDVRTELKDVSYFFLGNGLIQAAVQAAPGGDGTPVGLLIMDPERLRKKRESPTMDAETGLERTAVRIIADGAEHRAAAGAFEASWENSAPVPTVAVCWRFAAAEVTERFFYPDMERPVLIRDIAIRSLSRRRLGIRLETGVREILLARSFPLNPGAVRTVTVAYTLDAAADIVRPSFGRSSGPGKAVSASWAGLTRISFGDSLLDRFFAAARAQLPAVISRAGTLDGSIWQYNREWLRDQSIIALAMTMLGAHDRARTMFHRLIDKFVTDEGDTVDSSERRAPDEVELDQNGYLLSTLRDYVLWTGDRDILRRHWPKIVAAAEFPLRDVFRHRASGLLANRREFWERHRAHGIEPGLELVHQLFTTLGLGAAAALGRMTGHYAEAVRWESESLRIKRAMLENPRFRMVDNRGFIKRRLMTGPVQEKIAPLRDSGLPKGSPLAGRGPHFLNPDASSVLPLALGLVGPDSPLCALTLGSAESLWNQVWTGGGYGRYNATSEPDSPGAWPIASLFIARASIEAGRPDNAWRVLRWMDTVAGAKAGSWFEFYGHRLSPPFPQVGILPWTWAEIVILFVNHVLGVRPEEIGLRVRPRLLPGLKEADASLPFQNGRLDLSVRTRKSGAAACFSTDSLVLAAGRADVLLAYPGRDFRLEASVRP
jgi:hypothetical protein